MIDASKQLPITKLAELAGLSPGRAFRWAALRNTHFRADDDLFGYDFTGADFTGADVRGADFSGATGLDTAILTGVIDDPATRWPRGLQPVVYPDLVPPGRFLMGTTKAERRREKVPEDGWGEHEFPRHEVVFAQGFCIGRLSRHGRRIPPLRHGNRP